MNEKPIAWRPLIWAGLSFILLTVALFSLINWIGLERLQEMIATAGALAPLLYIALRAATYVVAPVSSGPVQFSSGLLFGVLPGTLYSLIGEVIGGSIAFWIARRLGRPAVQRFAGEDGLRHIDRFYERAGEWRTLVAARLVLFSFYDFISYAVGLTPLKFRTYLLISSIAGFVPTFAAVALGTGLGSSEQRVGWIVAILVVGTVIGIVGLTNKRARYWLNLEPRD